MQRSRITYVDWMRGFACLLMFQTHAYDSWLSPAARQSDADMYSQLLGTFPAPLFLFLAGFSVALGIDRMESRGASRLDIARTFAKRGAEIFAIAILFRVQQWAFGWGWSRTIDMLRVDILNNIGLSLALAALIPLATGCIYRRTVWSFGVATAIALATPPISVMKFHALPWWLAAYINGPNFPIFPWTAFLFVGVGIGFIVMRARKSGREGKIIALLAGVGAAGALLSRFLDHLPGQFYDVYNYWLTSPNFFLARAGLLLIILAACYAWCALKPGKWWSPIEQLGSTSLFVYWVHIELVYGRLSIMHKRTQTFAAASWGLVAIVVLMVALSYAKKRFWEKGHS